MGNVTPNTPGNWSSISSLKAMDHSNFRVCTHADSNVGETTITRQTEVLAFQRNDISQSMIITNEDQITLELTSGDFNYYYKWMHE